MLRLKTRGMEKGKLPDTEPTSSVLRQKQGGPDAGPGIIYCAGKVSEARWNPLG